MEIVVTGGSGFVGRELVRQLFPAEHRLRLLLRRPTPASVDPDHPNVRYVLAAFDDAAALTSLLAGADAVIHLVGIISEVGSQTFDHVHRDLTGMMVAATRAAGVRRFIHMSALGTRPEAPSRYHRSKWEAEEIVRTSALDWTIFRPSLIYGPEDYFANLFAGLARWLPFLPVMGPGDRLLQPVAVGQVARAFAAALTHSAAIGQTYDLCGPERLNLREILREILRATGRRRPLISIPVAWARWQAACLEMLYPKLLRRPPPFNRDQLLMLQEDNVGDGSRADREFGLQHTPFQEALALQFGGK